MEQLRVVTAQDNERMFRILSELITKDKEFQIMITVPAGKETTKKTPKKVKKIGRNDPCPCGSGKKYKQCCGK